MKIIHPEVPPQTHDIPCVAIPFVNHLLYIDGYVTEDDETINTYTSCGLDFIVASAHCSYPQAMCVTILTRLAYAADLMHELGRDRKTSLNFELDGNEGTMKVTFVLRPEGNSDMHLQFVIHGNEAHVVLPAFNGFGYGYDKWLRERIVAGIHKGMDMT